MTERRSISESVMQGDVFGPILCSVQVDKFGKECMEEHKYTYLYKGEVKIPPLSMVDDLVCISECGLKTAMVNSYINVKTATKNLQFGTDKCNKMHIGRTRQDFKCQNLFVDGWEVKNVMNVETGSEV